MNVQRSAVTPLRVALPARFRHAVTRVQLQVVTVAVLLPLAAGSVQGCWAAGIESIEINPPSFPDIGRAINEKNQAALKDAEDSFQNSELLQKLKTQSAENKDKNKKALEAKYCQRQAEIGVGDCGGLRFIPGATKNGKQRTPDWLSNLLGVENAPQTDPNIFK